MIPFNKPPYTGNEDKYVMANTEIEAVIKASEYVLKDIK